MQALYCRQLYLETGGGDLLGTLSNARPRAAASTQSKFTSGLVGRVSAACMGVGTVGRPALPAWTEQESREEQAVSRSTSTDMAHGAR
jgi:hypothetical protein